MALHLNNVIFQPEHRFDRKTRGRQFKEGWQSGLMHRAGNPEYLQQRVSWVQIPLLPPEDILR